MPPIEALMPFSICAHRRFSVCCPVTYRVGLSKGSTKSYMTGWSRTGQNRPPPTRINVDRRSDHLQYARECSVCGSVRTPQALRPKRPLWHLAEFRRKNPSAKVPETASPGPYLLTRTENSIIDNILALLNTDGLTSYKSLNLLERVWRGIEMGRQLANGTTP